VDSTAVSPSAAAAPTVGPLRGIARKLFGDDGLSFRDVLDLVNPLQHIPVVGNIYRELTGDELAPAVRVAGGALFGGPLGAALSVAGLVIESGKDAVTAPEGTPDSPLPDTDSMIAAAAEAPRGGWLIAAATTGTVAPFVPLGPASPVPTAPATIAAASATPRGGWMLGAAVPASNASVPAGMPGIEPPASPPDAHPPVESAATSPIPEVRSDLLGLRVHALDGAAEHRRDALDAFASTRALATPFSARLSVLA